MGELRRPRSDLKATYSAGTPKASLRRRLGSTAAGLLLGLGILAMVAPLVPGARRGEEPAVADWYFPPAGGMEALPSGPTPVRPLVLPVATPPVLPAGAAAASESVAELPEATVALAKEEVTSPVPESYAIVGVPMGRQERNLNCEFQSAADLARFYGQAVTWEDLYRRIGHDPNGDPNVGFVGSSFEDLPGSLYPDGYGVYARPIAEGLRALGLNARAHSMMGREWLMREISAGRPVIVWATYDMAPAEVVGWQTKDGARWIKAVRNEHTFIAIGYDGESVALSDPFDGVQRTYDWDAFLTSWSYLDQMAVSVQPPFLLVAGEG